MDRRLVLAGLTLIMGVAALTGLAQAKPPALVISNVLAPVPPGAEPGGQMFVQATVTSRRALGPAQLVFYLASNPMREPDNVRIASAKVPFPALPGPQTAGATATVPQDVPPGFYFVLACAGNDNCAASQETIDVVGQALSAIEMIEGPTLKSAPGKEYFPERPADGLSLGAPFDCPRSAHGQSHASCVWVTSSKIEVKPPDQGTSLMYCPRDRAYPYQVLIGFDPLWNDLTTYPSFAKTNGISKTKFKTNLFGPLSYSGTDPSDPLKRGYALFRFICGASQCTGIGGKVQYLCADKPTLSALP
jgi:hypothetical protein